jgi:hypothetical protein
VLEYNIGTDLELLAEAKRFWRRLFPGAGPRLIDTVNDRRRNGERNKEE